MISKAAKKSRLSKANKIAIDQLIVGSEIAKMADQVFAQKGLKEKFLSHMRNYCKKEMMTFEYFIERIPEIQEELKNGWEAQQSFGENK
ncbi:hypothetical protein [Pseudidiomarina aestuarii]|uniref:hypothetical protein n=1 Tax=Pseudidiomarina aestuarii TaxID=624146 RepID=UPI003A97DDA1